MNHIKAAAEEFQASREAVTLCDYSSFAKMDLWSAGTEVSTGIIYAKYYGGGKWGWLLGEKYEDVEEKMC